MKYKVGDEVNVLTDISPERLRELEESGVHITKVTPTEEVETRGIETCGEALEVVRGVQRRIAEAKDIETPTEEWAKKKV